MAAHSEESPVWIYVIFRKNHSSGHEKMTVNISFDGPIFWNRQVAYIYCCSCHFDKHEVHCLNFYFFWVKRKKKKIIKQEYFAFRIDIPLAKWQCLVQVSSLAKNAKKTLIYVWERKVEGKLQTDFPMQSFNNFNKRTAFFPFSTS